MITSITQFKTMITERLAEYTKSNLQDVYEEFVDQPIIKKITGKEELFITFNTQVNLDEYRLDEDKSNNSVMLYITVLPEYYNVESLTPIQNEFQKFLLRNHFDPDLFEQVEVTMTDTINELVFSVTDEIIIFEKKNSNDNSITEFEDLNTVLNKDTLEPVDMKEYEVSKIIDIITDVEEIKKYENAGSNVSTDLTIKKVDIGQIIYLTALLKPRNKSTAYPIGEMGVIRAKVTDIYYGLGKLNQLKRSGKLIA